MCRAFGYVGVVVLVFGASWTGVAQPDQPAGEPLTLEETLNYALDDATSQSLRDSHVAEAEGARQTAGRWPDPAVGYEHEQVWQPNGIAIESVVAVSQDLPIWGVPRLRDRAAEQELQAARAEGDVERLARRIRIERTFYEVLHAQRLLESARDWLQRARQVDTAGSEDDEREPDALRSLRDARNEVDRATAVLARRTGELAPHVADHLPPESAPFVRGALVPDELPPLESFSESVPNHPELVYLRTRRDAEEFRAEAARLDRLPTPQLTGGYIQENEPGVVNHGFVGDVWLRIPIFSLGDGRLQQADARRQRWEARLELERRKRLMRTPELYRAAEHLHRRALRYRDEILPATVRRLDRLREADDAGAEALLDAQREVYETRKEMLQASLEARQAIIDLEEAAGVIPERE